jgi:hypothetical protein
VVVKRRHLSQSSSASRFTAGAVDQSQRHPAGKRGSGSTSNNSDKERGRGGTVAAAGYASGEGRLAELSVRVKS